MKTVKRYETMTFEPVHRADGAFERTPEGFLKIAARISRIGVQVYQQPDGSQRRELRLPEEVFSRDSLASFSMKPLTLYHPPEPVTPDNVQKYSVGTVAEQVNHDGKYAGALVVVHHKDAITAIERGMRELSCGYSCVMDDTPGVWEGQRYDSVQRQIRGNHLALVPAGRAGPEVRLKMDATDAEQVEDQSAHKGDEVEKIRIDGIEVEVSTHAAQLFRKFEKERNDAIEKLNADLVKARTDATTASAKADVATGELAKVKQAHTDALDPKKMHEQVKARVALERSAATVLGTETKLDAMTDMDIRRAVIAKEQPDIKLDGKEDGYVLVAYDMTMANVTKRDAGDRPNIRIVEAPLELENRDDAIDKITDPVERLKARQREQNKRPIPVAAKK